MSNIEFEVIIIGGGPAGMSAGLVLGRSRIKTLILNTQAPRNNATTASHGFLTQDGKHPSEIFKTAFEQLSKYPVVCYKKAKALSLTLFENGFKVETETEVYIAKRVIIATGYIDNINELNIPNLNDVYGISVYPCPFCDGFELADKKLAIFGDPIQGPIFSKLISHWSKDIIVFTNGEPITHIGVEYNLDKNNIKIIDQKIKSLNSNNGTLESITLENGTTIEREAGFIADVKATESSNFAQALNLTKELDNNEKEIYSVNGNYETELKGLFIIGDARSGWSRIAGSVSEGSKVAVAITRQIINKNWK
jgi:thioredoxin reductase